MKKTLFISIFILAAWGCGSQLSLVDARIDTLEENVAADPNNAEAHYELGLAQLDHARFEEARGQFIEALSLNSHYSSALFALYCFDQFSSAQVAVPDTASPDSLISEKIPTKIDHSLFSKAVATGPFFSWSVASILLPENDAPDRIISAVVREHYPVIQDAVMAFFCYDFENAILQMNDILQEHPELAQLRFFKAISFIYLKYYREAAKEFSVIAEDLALISQHEILPMSLTEADLNFFIAHSLNRAKNLGKSFEYFTKVLEIDPRYYMAHYWRADFYNRQKEYQKALVELNAALQIIPNDADIRYQKAMLLAKMAKYNEAVTEFQMLVTLTPTYYKAYLNLAASLEKVNRSKDAIEYYEKFLTYTPNTHPKMIAYAKAKLQKLQTE